jgi:hypothetical protein
MPNDEAAAALQAKARSRHRQAHGDGRREHDGLRAGAAAPSTRPVVEDGSRAVGQLSRDLDEAVGVLPATRLENDRGTGTPEDANGDTLSPGLDKIARLARALHERSCTSTRIRLRSTLG